MSDTKVDYEKLYESSTKELKTLGEQQAILTDRIKESAAKLGVAPKKEEIETLIETTKKEKVDLETKLGGLVEELDQLQVAEVEETAEVIETKKEPSEDFDD